MRYSKEHKEQTRIRILDTALEMFRSEGYSGVGVEEMVKSAGVTSGAFYGHFESKSDAFRIVSVEGLVQLRNAIENCREQSSKNWLETFTHWYFSLPKKKGRGKSDLMPLQGGCALPNLSPEVARSNAKTKMAYQKELLRIIDAIAAGIPDRVENKHETAWAILSLMAGGVMLSRSVGNKKVSSEIVKSSLLVIDGLIK